MATKYNTLILGNGFNYALNEAANNTINVRLGYSDIIEGVKKYLNQQYKDDEGAKVLLQFIEKNKDIPDVEWLLWILENSAFCLKHENGVYFNLRDTEIEMLTQNACLLKKCFINVITDPSFHPKFEDIFKSNNQKLIDRCANNINLFDRVFTINYDLILYWLLNEKKLLQTRKNKEGKFRDGFINRIKYKPKDINNDLLNYLSACYSENNRANFFFLHGAIHLLRNQSSAELENAYKIVRGYYQVEINDDFNEFGNLTEVPEKKIHISKSKEGIWHIKYMMNNHIQSSSIEEEFDKEVDKKINKAHFKNKKKYIIDAFLEKHQIHYTKSLLDLREMLLEKLNEFDTLAVLEGGSEKKVSKLYDNIYLRKCYDKLVNCNGSTIIYGCKILGEDNNITSDRHIWGRILDNSNEIFISCHLKDNESLQSKANLLKSALADVPHRKSKNIVKCFSANDMGIWTHDFSKLLNGNIATINFDVFQKK